MWFYKGFYIQELNATLDDFITVLAVFNQSPLNFIRFQLILKGILIRFQLILTEFNSILIDVKRNFNQMLIASDGILIRFHLIFSGI